MNAAKAPAISSKRTRRQAGSTRRASNNSADYSRIHRLLRIISLIQAQKGWTSRKLAEECGKSERTIFRDLQMLQGAGIPFFHDEESKCYQIRRDYFMKPVELTLEESLALVALGEHIGAQEQIPFTRAAARAVAKVRSQLPDSIRRDLEGLDRHVAIKLASAGTADGIGDVYAKVRQAIAEGKALRCRYEPANGQGDAQERFLFKPYTLLFNQRAWYAAGHHGGRDAVRFLKLNRFLEIEGTNQSYAVPRDFSLREHLGNAWRMIRGRSSHDVEVEFDAEFAETIADTHWHPTQQIDWRDDGTITFRCRVDGLEEIVWWVLSMGPHCRVVKPAELAQRVRDLAAGVVARYPPDPPEASDAKGH